jgi:hypothetical protein
MKVITDLHRPTLITAQEVVKVLSTAEGVDLKRISNNIIVAEERFLRHMMGFELYDALVEQKNTEVTTGNKDALQTAIRTEWSNEAITLNVGDTVNSIDFLSEDNKKLWKMYLWSLAAECVFFVAYPDNYTDFTSSGIVHNAPKFDAVGTSKTNTPELGTIKWQMDKMMTGRIGPLQESFHQYLCNNAAKFPLYKKKCDCDVNGKSYAGSSGVLTDVYPDDKEIDCPCEDA